LTACATEQVIVQHTPIPKGLAVTEPPPDTKLPPNATLRDAVEKIEEIRQWGLRHYYRLQTIEAVTK